MSILEKELKALANIRKFGQIVCEEIPKVDYTDKVGLVEVDYTWSLRNKYGTTEPGEAYTVIVVNPNYHYRDVFTLLWAKAPVNKAYHVTRLQGKMNVVEILKKERHATTVIMNFDKRIDLTRLSHP